MVKYKAAIIGACAAVALAAAPLTPASAHSYHHGWPVFGLAALGAAAKRPLGVPCVNDRALQRSTAQVLSAIYEADFLPCSFGGRPERGAHHALATLNEVIAGGKVSWVLEADLKNFFGSLSHEWVLRFVEHCVGDPRMITLIRR